MAGSIGVLLKFFNWQLRHPLTGLVKKPTAINDYILAGNIFHLDQVECDVTYVHGLSNSLQRCF